MFVLYIMRWAWRGTWLTNERRRLILVITIWCTCMIWVCQGRLWWKSKQCLCVSVTESWVLLNNEGEWLLLCLVVVIVRYELLSLARFRLYIFQTRYTRNSYRCFANAGRTNRNRKCFKHKVNLVVVLLFTFAFPMQKRKQFTRREKVVLEKFWQIGWEKFLPQHKIPVHHIYGFNDICNFSSYNCWNFW